MRFVAIAAAWLLLCGPVLAVPTATQPPVPPATASIAGIAPLYSPAGQALDAGTVLGQTLAGRAANTINIRDYGATGNGTTDDSAALAAAVTQFNTTHAAGVHACLYIPPGVYKISSPPPTFVGAGCVRGGGSNQTYLNLTTSFAGALFSWSDAWSASNYLTSNMSNVGANTAGPVAEGFTVEGNQSATGQQDALDFFDHTDYAVVRDVQADYITGRFIYLGGTKNDASGFTRESNFWNVRCYSCGSASIPVVEITASGTGDSSNQIDFYDLNIVANLGPGLVVRNANTSKAIGSLRFFRPRIEGTTGTPTTAGNLVVFGDLTMAGSVQDVQMFGLRLNGVPTGYSGLLFEGPASTPSGTPSAIDIYGDIGTGSGTGVNVQGGSSIRLHLTAISVTGTSVIVAPNGNVGRDILLDGNGAEASWTYAIDTTAIYDVKFPVFAYGQPLGQSFLSARRPDFGSIGGPNRGQYAVDLSLSPSSNGATGQYTVACGGNNPIVSGLYAVACGGLSPQITGPYSGSMGGAYAIDRGDTAWPWSNGRFAVSGDQNNRWTMVSGTLSTITAVRLTSNGGAATASNSLRIPQSQVSKVSVDGAACTDTTNRANWAIWNLQEGALVRPATGNPTYTGAASGGIAPSYSGGVSVGGGGATMTIGADTTNQNLSVTVTWPDTNATHCVAWERVLEVE